MTTFEFALPDLGEGIESGDVVNVLVAVGEVITAEQPVLELETDKAVVEVPAPVDGTVTTIHVQAGDKAAVGQIILTLETNHVAAPVAPPAPVPTPVAAPPEPPAEKAAPAPVAPPPQPAEPHPQVDTQSEGTPRQAAPASPSVRRLAREIGIDIHQVPGAGPGGRIAAEDVKRYARSLRTAPPQAAPGAGPLILPLPDFTKWGTVQREPMSNVRRKTAEQMTQSWLTIPHVTQYDKADVTDLEHLRQRFSKKAESVGGRLTVTAIVLKVVASALKIFPQFNASVDMTSHEVVYKAYYHIGIAVDTDRGLLVPVIRDVDQKNILTLATELTEMAERARNRRTSLEEMQGGTFTITNLGGLGGTNFSPIINAPEVAILGLSRGSMEPVYRDDQFVPRRMLPLALSYDHRVIDGADGVRFLRWIVEALEQPFLLSLEG